MLGGTSRGHLYNGGGGWSRDGWSGDNGWIGNVEMVLLLLLMLLALATLSTLALGLVTVLLLSISLLLLGEVRVVAFAIDYREFVGLLAAIIPIVALALFAAH
jgi:hypothetical protein